MKRYALPVIGFVLVGALAGCGQSQTSGNAPSASESASASAEESKRSRHPKPASMRYFDELFEAYNQVLDDPTAYKFNHPDPSKPVSSYSYTLADTTGDGVPELLLRADVSGYSKPVVVFGKPKGGKFFNTRETLIDGHTPQGESRALVGVSRSGNGLYQITRLTADSIYEVEHFVVRDNKLVPGDPTTERPYDKLETEGLTIPTWYPSDERLPLEGLRRMQYHHR